MEEAGNNRPPASSGPICMCQSGCLACSSPQSTPDIQVPPNPVPVPQMDPAWMGILATAMAGLSSSNKLMMDYMMGSSPAQPVLATVPRDKPAKRPRVDPPSLSSTPLAVPERTEAYAAEDLMDDCSFEDDRSEGECSDLDQSGEPEVSPSMSAMVEELISAVRDTFDIQDPPVLDSQKPFVFFPAKSGTHTGKVFPVCEDLTKSLTKAWAHPEKKFIQPKRLALLYPFPADEVTTWSTAPRVDPPVARLAKHTTLPVVDGASLRDPADRRVEFFSKSVFETSGSALRPAFASAWVARGATEWALRLQRDMLAGAPVTDLQADLSLIIKAVKFLSEASFDVIALIAQSSALSVAVRRALWLKVWAADTTSKRSLVNLPFLGRRLFGDRLDVLISEATGGKSTLLPQNRPTRTFPRGGARSQSFRRPQASNFQAGQGYKPDPAQGKKPSFKPRPNWRGRKPGRWQPAQSSTPKQGSA